MQSLKLPLKKTGFILLLMALCTTARAAPSDEAVRALILQLLTRIIVIMALIYELVFLIIFLVKRTRLSYKMVTVTGLILFIPLFWTLISELDDSSYEAAFTVTQLTFICAWLLLHLILVNVLKYRKSAA